MLCVAMPPPRAPSRPFRRQAGARFVTSIGSFLFCFQELLVPGRCFFREFGVCIGACPCDASILAAAAVKLGLGVGWGGCGGFRCELGAGLCGETTGGFGAGTQTSERD